MCWNTAAKIEFFNERIDKTVLSTLEHVAESKFGHITYTDAIQELKKSGKTWEFPVEWGVDLQTEHERFLSEELFKKPVIVTDYPKDIKAFYMRVNDDNKTVRAMDVLVPGSARSSAAANARTVTMCSCKGSAAADWMKKLIGGISTCAGTAPSLIRASVWDWKE